MNAKLPCPVCLERKTEAVTLRSDGLARRRRYVCNACGPRFTTIELALTDPRSRGTPEYRLAQQLLQDGLREASTADLLHELKLRTSR